MKHSLVLLLFALSPLSALADDVLLCRQASPGPDRGYEARIVDLRKAQVLAQSIAGPRPVRGGDLDCVLPHTLPRPGQPQILAICTSRQLDREGRLVLSVRKDGRRVSAKLSEQNNRGQRLVAELGCHDERR
jgi:hypothetical protein